MQNELDDESILKKMSIGQFSVKMKEEEDFDPTDVKLYEISPNRWKQSGWQVYVKNYLEGKTNRKNLLNNHHFESSKSSLQSPIKSGRDIDQIDCI